MTTQPPKAPTQPTELRLEHEQDLSALRDLANPSQLTTLRLWRCPLSELRPQAELSQLTTLSLVSCEQVHDLGPLASLPQLPRFLTKAPGFDLGPGRDGSRSTRPWNVDGPGRAAPAARPPRSV
jgi:hypothetical protein